MRASSMAQRQPVKEHPGHSGAATDGVVDAMPLGLPAVAVRKDKRVMRQGAFTGAEPAESQGVRREKLAMHLPSSPPPSVPDSGLAPQLAPARWDPRAGQDALGTPDRCTAARAWSDMYHHKDLEPLNLGYIEHYRSASLWPWAPPGGP